MTFICLNNQFIYLYEIHFYKYKNQLWVKSNLYIVFTQSNITNINLKTKSDEKYLYSEDTDEGKKEKSAKTASGSGFDSVTSDNEEDKDKKESTGVFDDTFESLRRKAPQTGGYIAEWKSVELEPLRWPIAIFAHCALSE